jgi:hypothetical protein
MATDHVHHPQHPRARLQETKPLIRAALIAIPTLFVIPEGNERLRPANHRVLSLAARRCTTELPSGKTVLILYWLVDEQIWTWQNSGMADPIKSIWVDVALLFALAGGGWALARRVPENNDTQERAAIAALLQTNQEGLRVAVKQEREPFAVQGKDIQTMRRTRPVRRSDTPKKKRILNVHVKPPQQD